jgi:hypothetical protein
MFLSFLWVSLTERGIETLNLRAPASCDVDLVEFPAVIDWIDLVEGDRKSPSPMRERHRALLYVLAENGGYTRARPVSRACELLRRACFAQPEEVFPICFCGGRVARGLRVFS